MEKPEPVRTETAFGEEKPAYTRQQALVEANRCLYCHDAPCIKACPTSIDIPEFIRKIGTGNTRGAAATIFEANILGSSCARVCPVQVLCVGDCVYNELGVPPIQIGRLQRYATDEALRHGWHDFEAAPDTGFSVGLVGAGPASLAAAHRLRRLGHAVTLYEKREVIGGLNVTGVAPYKMNVASAEEEIGWLLSIGGIEIRHNVSVPDQLGWDELLATHDALFLGFGLGPDSRLEVQGAGLAGVEGAVAWIERMKLGVVDLAGVRRAVVIGGGNTAMDALRELCGLGVPEVVMVYRGTEASMSGYAHEWESARKAGARAKWQAQPVGFEGVDRVTGVRVVMLDANRRPLEGSEHVVDADLVLLAVGQSKLGEIVAGLDGVEVERGRVVTGAGGRTGHPKVFAGGDGANGGKEVVNAAAEGRDAALAIHAMLMGGHDG
jgi:dihydropyrimidine dehydrogenase (NAD+) subunit PreT